MPKVTYPPELPVSARRDDLLAAIRDHQVVVVAGETGSGKTTQLPKICLELGRGVRGAIGHTQPRRIAARTVAERIADELDVPIGDAVGFAVRFSDRSSEDTLVRVMTDGLLLAEVRRDPLLRRYDTIIVDEAHERSLNIDFLLGVIQRILPRRPDLKLIITSATIDPQRFAAHFGDAPVVEVSGRTYPVEVRYRPVVDPDDEAAGLDRDPVDAIGDAAEELLREGRGDILVFLSGEREIRDTADALRGRLRSAKDPIEILPLYARLSSAEQQKVFKAHSARRIVLATNVAETSLTVPGIKYVIDPGTARISRYSARLKVQRLPIERISQASADQRKGRCGRTSEGICIRLYTEADFAERQRFTDPEILRTNLASVILQMAAAGLGQIEDFPFLDPPDRRQVRDGLNLLTELRAIESGGGAARDGGPRLTTLGRRLSGLPVDPRYARMVLEADRLGCADEVIVIVAALSIQDPRERPAEKRQQADQQHARFADETSDFLAYLNLWRYLREQQRELSGNQFRKRCHAEFLHYLRVREWQDLAGQVRAAAREVGVKLNQTEADPEQVHVRAAVGPAVARRHARPEDARLPGRAQRAVRDLPGLGRWPGSSRRGSWPPSSSRPPGCGAATSPGSSPSGSSRWPSTSCAAATASRGGTPKRGDVVATERVILYGLPIVAGRTVAYGRIDPVLARELFIRRALVEGDWETRHAFVAENRRLVAEVEALEDRARRRGILAGDEALFAFFDERLPADVVGGASFDRWWRDERRARPDLLNYTRELLVDPAAADLLDPRARPTAWKQGDLVLALTYRFEPGAPDDGVTVHVPLTALGELRPIGFDWLVPAFRLELVTALMRGLPKELRKPLVPVPDVAARGPRADAPAQRAAARRARSRARGPARRAHPALGVGRRPAARAPADDVRDRGRAGPRRRLRARAHGAARAGRPAPAGRADRRAPGARAPRADDLGRRDAPARDRAARAAACAPIRRSSTRARASACAWSRRRRRRPTRCAWAPAACSS